jgi:6-phosphogluconate dehydrogenase
MELGLVGLGKMGINLLRNMRNKSIDVVSFDLNSSIESEITNLGSRFVSSLEDLVAALPSPKIIWVMVPSGNPTNVTVRNLIELLSEGDIIIDGGNSYYKDSVRLYQEAEEKGIHFLDCGSSGGQSGALNGGNFMIGGDAEAFAEVESLFQAISEEGGYLFTGAAGSGHYLKMVHNGIEYGMMQSIGEGFDLLEHCPYDYNNADVAQMWNHGSVVRSWLMELAAEAFTRDPHLENLRGIIASSGEGKWTAQEGLDLQVPLPVITTSLMVRYRSFEEDTFSGKVVASLRAGFGGHSVTEK